MAEQTPQETTAEPEPERAARRSGPGRVLIAVYGVFALAATARAGVQIATKFHEAPIAYLLSAFAGVVYIVATVTLARSGRTSYRVAVTSCTVELVGVITVGTYSLADSAAFPDPTVWSDYGDGYGFVPLVLPVLGLLWLRRTRARWGDAGAAG
jgi:cytochrome bd-type quinol oxidase subunit 2